MLRSIDRAVVAANRIVLMIALAAMSVIVFINVALRYLTNDSILWSEEVARYLMVWLTFLGIGLVLRLGGHMAVDSLQEALPQAAARAMRLAVVALLAAFCLFMIWVGIDYVDRTAVQSTPVTEIPFSYIAASIPLGFSLMLWHLFAMAAGYVATRSFEGTGELDQAGSI